jgi:hypothetical protein
MKQLKDANERADLVNLRKSEQDFPSEKAILGIAAVIDQGIAGALESRVLEISVPVEVDDSAVVGLLLSLRIGSSVPPKAVDAVLAVLQKD